MKSDIFFPLRSRASACLVLVVGGTAFFAGMAIAQTPPPTRNIAPGIHPYLAQAQYFVGRANESVLSAQKVNGYALNGHAENARRLLDEASAELKAAAVTANGSQP